LLGLDDGRWRDLLDQRDASLLDQRGRGGLAESVTRLTPGAHDGLMATARPLPEAGSIFLDARGGNRAMRVSWHQESGLVVLSLWRENVCAGSFRLAVDEVPELIDLLREGLDRAYDVALGRRQQQPHDTLIDQGPLATGA
jgi:hypothetical protein